MKKTVIRDLNTQQEMVRFEGPLQLGFAIYSIIFILFCKREQPLEPYLDFTISVPVFAVLYVIAIVLSAAVLIHNRKHETKWANKTTSYLLAVANLLMGISWFMNFA